MRRLLLLFLVALSLANALELTIRVTETVIESQGKGKPQRYYGTHTVVDMPPGEPQEVSDISGSSF